MKKLYLNEEHVKITFPKIEELTVQACTDILCTVSWTCTETKISEWQNSFPISKSLRKENNTQKQVTNFGNYILCTTIFRFHGRVYPNAKKLAHELRNKVNYGSSVLSKLKLLLREGLKQETMINANSSWKDETFWLLKSNSLRHFTALGFRKCGLCTKH